MKICVLYCANSLETGELGLYTSQFKNVEFNMISLPCSGKVDIPYMVKAFETGVDGMLVITCPEGKCHNLEGNLRAIKRVQAVDSLLEETGVGKGHISVIQLEEGDTERIIEKIKEFINMNMEKTT